MSYSRAIYPRVISSVLPQNSTASRQASIKRAQAPEATCEPRVAVSLKSSDEQWKPERSNDIPRTHWAVISTTRRKIPSRTLPLSPPPLRICLSLPPDRVAMRLCGPSPSADPGPVKLGSSRLARLTPCQTNTLTQTQTQHTCHTQASKSILRLAHVREEA
jgi:hypothetical protein